MQHQQEGRRKLFGTNGIRGIPNEDLSVEFSQDMGKAIGSFFKPGVRAVARDTRLTGPMILNAVTSGMMACGSSIVDLGILPTPALQYYCKTRKIYGVMITASHNPPMFNGIKCIDKDGTELSQADEMKIEDTYYDRNFKTVGWQENGTYSHDNSAKAAYEKAVIQKVNTSAIASRELRVAFDAGNGASYITTPEILLELNCKTVALNCNADGKFTSRESEPKPENLGNLITLMKSGEFDIGIAHDGDADRAVFIDEKGNFVDGDKSLALIVKHVIGKGDKVVTPVSSSDAMKELCENAGATLIQTRVGAPIVSRTMIREKATIGGEENGGVIYPNHQFCRDGAMTAALMLDILASSSKPLSELVGDLPDYFLARGSVRIKKPVNEILASIENSSDSKEIDRTDGLKISEGSNWVLIRPSGTEPIIRVYAQGRTVHESEKLANLYLDMIRKLNS